MVAKVRVADLDLLVIDSRKESIPLALTMLPDTRFGVVWSDLRWEAVEIRYRSIRTAKNA